MNESFSESLDILMMKVHELQGDRAINDEVAAVGMETYKVGLNYVNVPESVLRNSSWNGDVNLRYGADSVMGTLCEVRACGYLGTDAVICQEEAVQKAGIDILCDGETYQVKMCGTEISMTGFKQVIVNAHCGHTKFVQAKWMLLVDNQNSRIVQVETAELNRLLNLSAPIVLPFTKLS